MKILYCIALVAMMTSCQKTVENSTQKLPSVVTSISPALVTSTTRPSHVVFVWFENKGYSKIVGSSSAPYINSLIPKGTLFTNYHRHWASQLSQLCCLL
jgi:hypothetical protein